VRIADGKWREDPVVEKLAIWLIFGVIVSLLPFLFSVLTSIGSKSSFIYSQILGGGQLLLVAVAISAGAFGDLIFIDVPKLQRMPKVLAIGSCVVEILVASAWFGIVAESDSTKTPLDPVTISLWSILVFAWALLSSGSCLSIATRCKEVRERDASQREPKSILEDAQEEEG
jgi:hypothetical protein